ncbi:hypothetical protein AAIH46_18090 [Rhizobium sp. 0TCS1.26]|uniref:hypothetical protein n=1 Tax=Rhizobium sp. 0TCS1.26 TaxID=3142623 RepID=UPI003D2BFB1C
METISVASEKTTKLKVKDLAQLHVVEDAMYLLLVGEDGDRFSLQIPPGIDSEIVHIMADALRERSKSEFDPKAGHLLVHSHVQPARSESAISPLGLQEKFVLSAKSAGMTTMTHRLSEESVRRWIDDMEVMLAKKGKSPRKTS